MDKKGFNDEKKHVTRRLRRSCSTERREIKIKLDLLIIGSDHVLNEPKIIKKNDKKQKHCNEQSTKTIINVLSLDQKTSQILLIFDK